MPLYNDFATRSAERAAPPFVMRFDAKMGRVSAVSLIDRRTGAPHCINGRPMTLFTRHLEEAGADLLSRRDAPIWDVCVQPVQQGAGK